MQLVAESELQELHRSVARHKRCEAAMDRVQLPQTDAHAAQHQADEAWPALHTVAWASRSVL